MLRPRRNRRHVLVVEDDASLSASIRELLESMEYVVSTVSNSAEAMVEIRAQRPDAILTDIYMPEGDGYELISMIRSFGDNIPIVAMSGGPIQCEINDYLGMAKRLGAVAAIEKPFRAAELIETIDRAIGGRLAA